MSEQQNPRKLHVAWRTIIEVCSILFLFYSNLLMGEFTRGGRGNHKGLLWALHDIFTKTNFIIGFVAALIGYLAFEFFRSRF
jgi:hypothetical protein